LAAHDEMAWVAERVLRHRKRRWSFLPAPIFSEYAWEALLHLFIADAKSERLTGNDLATLVAVPPTLMSRWMKYLGEQKLIDGDSHGEMNVLLTLSAEGLNAIEQCLSELQSLGHEFSIRQNGGERR